MGTTVRASAVARWLPAAIALALVATACAHDRRPRAEAASAADESEPFFEEDAGPPSVADPLESMNRPIFGVNMTIDRAFTEPIADAYGAIAPEPVKRAVRSIFANFNMPVVLVNQALQLDGTHAAKSLGRMVLNSTLGVGGIFDPAAELGWNEEHADFGQTLGKYGVGPGAYLVLPLLGPSTARDAVGTIVDLFLRIDTWLLPLQSQILLGGGIGISERENKREELRQLRESSLDFYAAVRSAYLQMRAARVREARSR